VVALPVVFGMPAGMVALLGRPAVVPRVLIVTDRW
jgi:hypothetical protein